MYVPAKQYTRRTDMSTQATLVAGVVAGLIVVAALLGYGLYVWASVASSVASLDMGSAANNLTRDNIISNVWSGFSLMSPIPLIMAAGAIITILLAAFLWIRSR